MHEFHQGEAGAELSGLQGLPVSDSTYTSPDVTIARQVDTQPPAYSEVSDQLIVASESRRAPYMEVIERPALGESNAETIKGVETPPRYLFVGLETQDNPEQQRMITDVVNGICDRASFEGESPPTPDERAVVIKLGAAMCEIGLELGVDPSSRLLRPEHYHFFDRREDLAKAYGKPDDEMIGTYHPYKGILLERSGIDGVMTLAHETAHSLALRWFRYVSEPGKKPVLRVSSSYVREPGQIPEQVGIGELVTEIFADRAVCRVGVSEKFSKGGYMPLNIIGDAVIEETAGMHGTSPKEVEDLLLRGYLNGDQAGIRLIRQTLGMERMTRFQEFTGQETIDKFLQIAHGLRLPRAVASIERHRDDKPFEIFRWRSSLLRP